MITDPPYDTLEASRAAGTTRPRHTWFPVLGKDDLLAALTQAWDALRRDRHLLVFCDDPASDWVKPHLQALGATRCRRLIWDKLTPGMGYVFRRQYEFIVWAEKGRGYFREHFMGDVFRWPRMRDGRPVRKPPGLIEILLHHLTEPGWVVLDPFAGSGSVGEAARATGRRAVICDLVMGDPAFDRHGQGWLPLEA